MGSNQRITKAASEVSGLPHLDDVAARVSSVCLQHTRRITDRHVGSDGHVALNDRALDLRIPPDTCT